MTSRERVLAAFARSEPDIVPRWCVASPDFLAEADKTILCKLDEDLAAMDMEEVETATP